MQPKQYASALFTTFSIDIKQQAIIWSSSADIDLCRHMASLGHKESQCLNANLLPRSRIINWVNSNKLEFANSIEIFGTISSNNSQDPVEFVIGGVQYMISVSTTKLNTSVKIYIWRSIGAPSLM